MSDTIGFFEKEAEIPTFNIIMDLKEDELTVKGRTCVAINLALSGLGIYLAVMLARSLSTAFASRVLLTIIIGTAFILSNLITWWSRKNVWDNDWEPAQWRHFLSMLLWAFDKGLLVVFIALIGHLLINSL